MARNSRVLPAPDGPLHGEAFAVGDREGERGQAAGLQMLDAQQGRPSSAELFRAEAIASRRPRGQSGGPQEKSKARQARGEMSLATLN